LETFPSWQGLSFFWNWSGRFSIGPVLFCKWFLFIFNRRQLKTLAPKGSPYSLKKNALFAEFSFHFPNPVSTSPSMPTSKKPHPDPDMFTRFTGPMLLHFSGAVGFASNFDHNNVMTKEQTCDIWYDETSKQSNRAITTQIHPIEMKNSLTRFKIKFYLTS
jgi:hypothetical protein